MPISLSTQSYSHSFDDQLDSILAQYNDQLEASVEPYTLENKSYSFLYLADLVFTAICDDLVLKGYVAPAPLSIFDVTNGEAQLLKAMISSINASVAAGVEIGDGEAEG